MTDQPVAWAANPRERWAGTPGGWDGLTDEPGEGLHEAFTQRPEPVDYDGQPEAAVKWEGEHGRPWPGRLK